MNLTMNLRDLELWEQGKLKVFAVPAEMVGEENIQTVGIKEPFRRITTMETIEKDGEEQEKKILAGIRYRFDDCVCLLETALATSTFEEAPKWSPASQLPNFAIRHHANVVLVGAVKPIQSFTEEDIELMCLDYALQDNPQLLLEEYLPIKNRELLFNWWKQHYKSTLKDCDNPMAVLLHFADGEIKVYSKT